MPHAEHQNEGQPRRSSEPSQSDGDAQAERSDTESFARGASETPTASGLTHRLSSVARPDPADQAELLQPSGADNRLAYFCEARHEAGEGNDEPTTQEQGLVSKWRQKERLKTTAVALVLCLNIGVDPPDVIKISPCARLECWVDPMSMQPPKALDTIGKNLQAQYERWQPRAKYKSHLDPTTDDVKKLAISCRRTAKNERVLFHYNGHGVPRPTANGEIWVFNKSYTQYIPLSVYDLQAWVGAPCIYVFDCSGAGMIINSYRQFAEQRAQEAEAIRSQSTYTSAGAASSSEDSMKECILLAACAANEMLPQNPDLPADVFTACLTTPIKVALRWFCSKSLLCSEGLTKDLIDRIPGKQTDRKTPLGELNWIFTAITDTIAWNTLPRALFQKLFRQDLLVASLFRNFLLAERIMHAANCTPISYPRLPQTHQHPMWQAWDMAAEMCLLQLPPRIVNAETEVDFQPSPFFSEQLTAFELWLEHGSKDKKPPEQLPIVLQVLLSQVHRLRALKLLGNFLDMGPWAVDLALSVGIFPYVLKLLQTTATDLRETLIFIWTKILALDRSCQDLVKDNGQLYFINYLNLLEERPKAACAQAAFILAIICDSHPRGKLLCAQAGLLSTLLRLLAAPGNTPLQGQRNFPAPETGLLVKWLCLCLGKLTQSMPEVAGMAIQQGAADLLARLLGVSNPEVRAAAVFALGTLIQGGARSEPLLVGTETRDIFQEAERTAVDRALACHLLQVVYDASPLVRAEVALALSRIVAGHAVLFQDAVVTQQRLSARIQRRRPPQESGATAHSAPTDTSNARFFPGSSASAKEAESPLEAARPDCSANGKSENSDGSTHSSLPIETAPVATSPGVYAAQTSGRFSSMPNESGMDSPVGSPGSARGNFASADAARVGGGLYSHLLDSLCTLATDPAPLVARMGSTALLVAGVQLTPIGEAPAGATQSRSAGQLAAMDVSSSGGGAGVHASASVANLSLGGTPSSKWHPRSLWRNSGKPLHSPSSVSTSPSSPSTNILELTNRLPYVLRQVHADAALLAMQRAQSLQSAASSEPGDAMGQGSSDDLHATTSGRQRLPESPAFLSASRYFSETLNDKDMKQWIAVGHSPGYGYPHKSVKAQWQPWRVEAREQEQEASLQALKSVHRSAELIFRLDQVDSINTESPGNTGVMLHPFRPLLLAVDPIGVVRVYSTRKPYSLKNAFYVSTGEGLDLTQRRRNAAGPPAATVVGLWQINQVFNGLLLTGAADGGVRVWRDYTFPRTQKLATAWQAVPLAQPSGLGTAAGQRAVFDWQESSGSLFAAGGLQPAVIHRWDLQQELCTQQINAGLDDNGNQPLRFLAASKQQKHLLIAATASTVRLFDLRASSKAAATLQPHASTPLMGIVLEPGGISNQLVTATGTGEMKLTDFRISDSGGRLGVFKTVQAHAKGNLSAISGHPQAPLIATGTTSQVVKLWSTSGEQRGVVRTQTSLLNSHRIGPISCLSFHPHRAVLASGSTDSIVTVYPIEHVQKAEVSNHAGSSAPRSLA